jgi:hypothetical protein
MRRNTRKWADSYAVGISMAVDNDLLAGDDGERYRSRKVPSKNQLRAVRSMRSMFCGIYKVPTHNLSLRASDRARAASLHLCSC